MPRLPLARLVAALAVALFPPAVLSGASEKSLIVATDLLQLKQLESPALSPDGRWVVYVVRSIEAKPAPSGETAAPAAAAGDWTYHTNLWLAATDGSRPPRQLTRGTSASAPVWSPLGDRIAFVRSAGEEEKPQVWVIPFAGGEATAVTRLETGAAGPRWSPDGAKLLFTSALTYAQVRAVEEKAGRPARPAWDGERPGRAASDTANHFPRKAGAAAPKADDATPDARPDGSLAERREWLARNEANGEPLLLNRLNFLSESGLASGPTFTHVFVQEARAGAEPTDLTPGFVGYAAPEWLPDGSAIVMAGPADRNEHPDRSRRTALYRVNLAGETAPLLDLPGHTVGNPLPSPDGRWIAFTAIEGEGFSTFNQTAVGIVPASGGAARLLTASQDRSASNLAWSADSRSILYTAPDAGRFPLFTVDLQGSRFPLTWQRDWGVRDFAVGASGLAQVVTHPGNPAELHYGTPDGKITREITTHNASWIAERRLSKVEAHVVTSEPGREIPYWTLAPTVVEPGRRYPLLLQIHGGPAAMWGPGEETMWFEFQYFAARGFAVVFANPRGSGGYGRDFQRANYRDWGRGPATDVLAAAAEASKQPFVDPARQVVTGGSYGGYLTAWIIGHDHHFRAAVAQRGVYDLPTFFGEGNAWRLVPLAWGGLPWEPGIREILVEQSPLTYVAAIRTPLLIQHGDNDRRTGFVQSEMLYKSLKVLGRDVEFVRYPRATHEMSRSGEVRQRLDSLVRYEEFFRRFVGEN